MKKYSSQIIIAILSSIFTLTAYKIFNKNEHKEVIIKEIEKVPINSISYNPGAAFVDFNYAAERAMPAVVHIKAKQVRKVKRYSPYPDIFRDFFGDDIFRRFFGPSPFDYYYREEIVPEVSESSGSGVIIKDDGYIVTNNHVIANADEIEVTLYNNKIYKAEVVGTDYSTDLALLKINEKELPYALFGNSDEVRVGDWVLAVGNPFNLNSTVTAGIISAKGRSIHIFNDKNAIESFLQTDAAINPGNSGGALVNLKGEVIGINTAIASPTGAFAGYGFAIPSNIAKKVVEDILKYGYVQRGTMGIIIKDVDGKLAKEKNLYVTEGVYIEDFEYNSPAEKAGLKKGDVIIEINNNKVRNIAEFNELISRFKPGDIIKTVINRNGKNYVYDIILKDKNAKEEKAINSEILNLLGIEIENINQTTAKKLGITGGIKITKIYDGIIKKSTDIKPGFIIIRVNGENIRNTDDFINKMSETKGGVLFEGIYEQRKGIYYYGFGI